MKSPDCLASRLLPASGESAPLAPADPLAIIHRYYQPGTPASEVLIRHSRRVADKALAVASRLAHLDPDLDFIERAAMLHDIGIFRTEAPRLHCHGSDPYIRHGIIGREILEQLGLNACALVCERHIGVGISREDILGQGLPLPPRDMVPLTLEEQIICYADKFFSKSSGDAQHPLEAIVAELSRYSPDKPARFLCWHRRFGMPADAAHPGRRSEGEP